MVFGLLVVDGKHEGLLRLVYRIGAIEEEVIRAAIEVCPAAIVRVYYNGWRLRNIAQTGRKLHVQENELPKVENERAKQLQEVKLKGERRVESKAWQY